MHLKNGITRRMMHIMTYERGSVILVPFPFSDLKGLKQRPALVISSVKNQLETNKIICMMITSVNPVFSTDYHVSAWQESGLIKPSVVKVNRLFTINSTHVKRTLGKLTASDIENVYSILLKIMQEDNVNLK